MHNKLSNRKSDHKFEGYSFTKLMVNLIHEILRVSEYNLIRVGIPNIENQ